MSNPPPKTPPKPANVPAPNSVPKLPQTIFNLEKWGSRHEKWGSLRNVAAPRRTSSK